MRLFDFIGFLKSCFLSRYFVGSLSVAPPATALPAAVNFLRTSTFHSDCQITACLQLCVLHAMSVDHSLPVSVTLTSQHFHELTRLAADSDQPVEDGDTFSASSRELSHYLTRYLISKGSRCCLGFAHSLRMKSRKQVLLMCPRLATFAAC